MLSVATDLPEASLQRQASVLLARRLPLVALLEQGDLPGAGQHAAAYERAARRLGIPRYGWLPEIWRAMRAPLDGDPDGALEHTAAAEAIRRADSFNAQLMGNRMSRDDPPSSRESASALPDRSSAFFSALLTEQFV
jgi:hypothetical protein